VFVFRIVAFGLVAVRFKPGFGSAPVLWPSMSGDLMAAVLAAAIAGRWRQMAEGLLQTSAVQDECEDEDEDEGTEPEGAESEDVDDEDEGAEP
jgi:hypothetical protein